METSHPNPDTLAPKRGIGRGLGLILLFSLLGAALACLGLYAAFQGIFNPWRALPAPPETVEQLAGATTDTLDVRAPSGQIYRLDLRDKRAWSAVDEPFNQSDEDCERYAADAPALDRVRERRYACVNYAEAGITTVFALRDDGRLYYWREESSAYTALFLMVIVPCGGGLIGALVGLVFALRRRGGSTGASDPSSAQ